MYAPRGNGLSEVGDVEVIPAGGQLHLFHLTLPNHDIVQHAVSDDGLAWRELPHALSTGDPGTCDDDMIWTMSVTERAGIYYMVYTALARAENGQIQRTALATSLDLVRWTKAAHNPIGEADPRWYEADLSASGRVSWRDPKPILVGDTFYAAICAREHGGPIMRRGCVGMMASRDLVRWEVRPPLFAPRRYWDLECPQVFEVGGHYYLTAAIMEDRTQRYWVAPRFEGPYEVPVDGGLLAPRGHYAGRVCRWQGLDLYYCWHRADYDWTGFRNPFGKFVVAPLVLWRRSDGTLGRRSFPGWTDYRDGPSTHLLMQDVSLYQSHPVPSDAWRVSAGGGMDVIASRDEVNDVWFEGELTFDAQVGGIGFRLDDQGGGYFVEVASGSDEVSLKKWLPVPHATDSRQPWFRYVELQRGRLPRAIERGATISFRLIVVGPYVECSLDDEVVLATLSAERTTGRIGLWAESGTVSAERLSWAPMREPRHT